jgi:hypothetical protein
MSDTTTPLHGEILPPEKEHITAFYAENFKRIKAVRLDLTGNVVQITGKNDQGKSSILDAILALLRDKRWSPQAPIREGADDATIQLSTGKRILVRYYKRKDDPKEPFTTRLLLLDPETGAQFPRAQEILDALWDDIAFDPLLFSRVDGPKRLEMLKRFIGDFDFAENDRLRQRDYDERTIVNRQLKLLEAQLQTRRGIIQEVPEPEPLDLAALEAAIAAAEKSKVDRDDKIKKRATVAAHIVQQKAERERYLAEAAELRQRAGEMEAAAQACKNEVDKWEAKLAAAGSLPEVIDATEAQRRKDAHALQVERHASYLRQKADRDDLIASIEQAKATADELTKAIEARDEKKRQVIADAKLPIEGLEVREDDLYLNNVPFSQASTAQQIRMGTAVALKADRQFPLCIIRDGSLLDADSMAWIGQEAVKHNYQVLIERVDASGETGIVIEDGHVKGQELPPQPIYAPATRRRKPKEGEPTEQEIDRSQARLGSLLGADPETGELPPAPAPKPIQFEDDL